MYRLSDIFEEKLGTCTLYKSNGTCLLSAVREGFRFKFMKFETKGFCFIHEISHACWESNEIEFFHMVGRYTDITVIS